MVRIDTEGYRERLKFALWGDEWGIEKDRYSRSLWISSEIEKDRVLGMQSDGLGEIEIFYLFPSPSSYLFQSFYFQ